MSSRICIRCAESVFTGRMLFPDEKSDYSETVINLWEDDFFPPRADAARKQLANRFKRNIPQLRNERTTKGNAE